MRLIPQLFTVIIISILIASPAQSADINATASRTSGVAPLSVFFNADLDRSSGSVRTFHNYYYSWNFGDTGSGTWGTNGKSKNTDTGAVASHVYETPGTYTATLTVTNPANGTTVSGLAESFEITVTNPDTYFSGSATTCISNTSDFTGCPVGATQTTSTNLVSILPGLTGPGERVLLRRGGTWTVGSTIWPSYNPSVGPVHIGAFGTCTTPDAQGLCSNAPQITANFNGPLLDLGGKEDWRVVDINFVGLADEELSGSITTGAYRMINHLFMRLNSTGFNVPLGWYHWRDDDTEYASGNSIVDCKSTGAWLSSVYADSARLTMMGNIFQDHFSSHALRVQNAHLGVIAHNYSSGASGHTTDLGYYGRHALKLHGPSPLSDPGTNGSVFYKGTYAEVLAAHGSDMAHYGLPNFTEFVQVHDNVFGGSSPWCISIGPQNDAVAEQVSDVIFERNKVVSDYGQIGNSPLMTISVGIEGRYNTVRNNIIDNHNGNTDSYLGVNIFRRGIEWTPIGNEIYNNTIYSPIITENTGAYGVGIVASGTGTVVRNNLMSFPNASMRGEVNDLSEVATISNNLMTDTPYWVDPNNATPLSRDFDLTSSSTASIDDGYTTPLLDDYTGTVRTGTYDIGAYEFADAEPPSTAIPMSGCFSSGAQLRF